MVPRSLLISTPCFFATAIYIASMIAANSPRWTPSSTTVAAGNRLTTEHQNSIRFEVVADETSVKAMVATAGGKERVLDHLPVPLVFDELKQRRALSVTV